MLVRHLQRYRYVYCYHCSAISYPTSGKVLPVTHLARFFMHFGIFCKDFRTAFSEPIRRILEAF